MPRDPEVFAVAMRAIATEEASRGPCPATGGRHALDDDQVQRLHQFGGEQRCRSCKIAVRLIERGRVELALSMVDTARVYAGLPRFTDDQRTFLRGLMGGRDPIITAVQQTQTFAELAREDGEL